MKFNLVSFSPFGKQMSRMVVLLLGICLKALASIYNTKFRDLLHQGRKNSLLERRELEQNSLFVMFCIVIYM